MKNIRLLRGSNNIRGIQIMGWEGERGSKRIGRTIINIHLPRTGGGTSKFRRRKLEEKREARSVSLAVWSGHGMESSTRGHE